jgi:hypothetical protein
MLRVGVGIGAGGLGIGLFCANLNDFPSVSTVPPSCA